MNADLATMLREWALSAPDGPEFEQIQTQIEYFVEELYLEYEPTRGAHPDFWDRMNAWLQNVPSEAQKKALVRLIPYIFFLGPREMECLYRAAYQHRVISWLVQSLSTALSSPTLNLDIARLVDHTWFCPITDSMRINAFYHFNGIVGRDYRPDWRSLAEFGDASRIESYIAANKIERIVLLEDFVGSGSQMKDAVPFAATLPSNLPILVVPLILSPASETMVKLLTSTYSNVEIRPVLQLSESALIRKDATLHEISLAPVIRTLAASVEPQMIADLAPPASYKWYGPFGFDNSGALLVMHTNCPDNSLPMIHHVAPQWAALFPRSSRI